MNALHIAFAQSSLRAQRIAREHEREYHGGALTCSLDPRSPTRIEIACHECSLGKEGWAEDVNLDRCNSHP